ncbi:putative nucleobase-ascorbate transporter 10 [Cynara cardunculus var. scolymus]|uniref:putative nucleobase-ascorbate transporter 10 n=1 Tax=Cynara cardunculus var. scolymus TaxID=59895 RepID=UPI000D6233FF|nr:putative nucleobase-ascorbate transporter 10 [Cynara cardunculus var. scolymus]
MSNAGQGESRQPAAPKQELQPHPVTEQLAGVEYCVNSPPPWKEAVLLGFQHYILTLGTTVLIPTMVVSQIGGDNAEKARVIQTLLFLSGFGTLMQTMFGTRLPSVVGGSHAFLIPIFSIIHAKRYNTFSEPHERFAQTMRGIQGALVITSAFQMIIGFLGLWRNIVKYLTPLSVVPLITFTGLGLYYLAFPMLGKCVEIGLAELVLIVLISQYLPPYLTSKKPMFDRFAVLLSVSIAWTCTGILTWSGAYAKSTDTLNTCRTDRSGLIYGAPWIYVPYPFQWGTPTFDVGEVLMMMVASFISSIESTGLFLATARYGSATPVPPSILSRGIGWLGVGTFLGGMCGTVTGFAASTENCGALALTRVGSRRVIQISAAFMIFFSVFGKFGAVFASIPLPIAAALYCICFGCVSSAGLGHLQFCNLNSFRTKFILGLSFSLGLSLPQFFREHWVGFDHGPVHTHARWFDNMVSVVLMSHASVAVMIAMVLDCTLCKGNDEYRKDWWEKFAVYGKDIRSDEFYKLPWQLNKLFPAL